MCLVVERERSSYLLVEPGFSMHLFGCQCITNKYINDVSTWISQFVILKPAEYIHVY